LLVDILHDNIDSLAHITLLQIGVSDEIGVLKDLLGLEIGWESKSGW
jgi:hypothetical protein